MNSNRVPLLVAIVGGSAAGKTWLADQLQSLLGNKAARLSLDDFYRDRSHLSPNRRARLNFDHPRAIDWPCVEQTFEDFLAGRPATVPSYDFATHSRKPDAHILPPKPVLLVDGLWLLHRRALRKLFALSIFVDCPASTRLSRRIARDVRARGRSSESVRRQFLETVEPMHQLHVAPQARWAHVCLCTPVKKAELHRIAEQLLQKL
jgi:uridine kinase